MAACLHGINDVLLHGVFCAKLRIIHTVEPLYERCLKQQKVVRLVLSIKEINDVPLGLEIEESLHVCPAERDG